MTANDYKPLVLGAKTDQGGRACFLFARDDRRLFSVAPGDKLIVELEEVPGLESWSFTELPQGFTVVFDGYINDHTWSKDGKRRQKGHEQTPAERRFVIEVHVDAEPGRIALEKTGASVADWCVEVDETTVPVAKQRGLKARRLDEQRVPLLSLSRGPRSRLSELAAR